ncbi:ankyrin repeat domain-containing protein [Undibacterium sp.]|uniref:ankyrin repeat domain-containing protein n=1 Tax=Undibacterium sp. TaxID=1914977 RepID=UPI0037539F21
MANRKPKQTTRPGVDSLGRTPLHYAAADANKEEILRLLNEGADPKAKDDNGWSPLHFATQSNVQSIVALLVEAGAEVDSTDLNGNTPLSRAVFSSKGNGELIQYLREAGADPLKANNYGVSPLSLARQIANYDIATFFSDLP